MLEIKFKYNKNLHTEEVTSITIRYKLDGRTILRKEYPADFVNSPNNFVVLWIDYSKLFEKIKSGYKFESYPADI